MFPTSSRTLLVGRNARSATARIKSLWSSQGLCGAGRLATRVSLRAQPCARTKSEPCVSGADRRPWYVRPAVSGWRTTELRDRRRGRGEPGAGRVRRRSATGRQRADRQLPGHVRDRDVPGLQRLAQHTHLVIAVRNAGTQDDPERRGDDHQPDEYGHHRPGVRRRILTSRALASHSRPVWIVDRRARSGSSTCRATAAAARAAPAAPSPRTRTPGRSARCARARPRPSTGA